MKLSDLRYVCCVSCGSTAGPLRNLDCLARGLKACAKCLAQHGADVLGREADRVLADAEPRRPVLPATCLHCGEPMLYNTDGVTRPVWCGACEAERQALR